MGKRLNAILLSATLLLVSKNSIAENKNYVECDDKNPCTSDIYNPVTQSCEYRLVPNETQYSDGNPCNGIEICQKGVLVSVTKKNSNPCTKGDYDAENNECIYSPLPDQTPIYDENCVGRQGVCIQGTIYCPATEKGREELSNAAHQTEQKKKQRVHNQNVLYGRHDDGSPYTREEIEQDKDAIDATSCSAGTRYSYDEHKCVSVFGRWQGQR